MGRPYGRPPIPPPEQEPFIPDEPGVAQQVFVNNPVTVTIEQPKGTEITAPITSNDTFYFRLSSTRSTIAFPMPLTVTGGNLSLPTPMITAEGIPSSIFAPGSNRYQHYYLPVQIAGYGTGSISFPADNSVQYFQVSGEVVRTRFSPRVFAINIPRRPIITIGAAQNPVGTFLDDEITESNIFVDFTWDIPVSTAFTTNDITVTSSNPLITVSKGTLENVGTVGTTTHYRMEFTITGNAISTITVTVVDGAIPAAGDNEASQERARSYTFNTFPAPMVTIGPAQNPIGTDLTQINDFRFFVDFNWDRGVGTSFIQADVNVTTNSSTLRALVDDFEIITPGRHFRAAIQLTGGGSAIVTVYVNAGAIPSTISSSESRIATRTYQASLPPIPPIMGTRSGPLATQSGGAIQIAPGEETALMKPELTIETPNINDVIGASGVPVNLTITYTFSEPVNNFNQTVPNYRFIPIENEQGISEDLPQLGIWSGLDGNATYQQIIEIQPDTAGKINIFVPPNVAESVENENTFGPEAPGISIETYYDTTTAGLNPPTVNISTPPTTYFNGTSFTTTFTWDQVIQPETFRSTQIIVGGATAGDLIPDSEFGNIFTMQITLPTAGIGQVAITVLSHRLVSTAALGVNTRREGPTETITETFLYDQAYTDPLTTVEGGSTLCRVSFPIMSNPSLNRVQNIVGGAFAGAAEIVYVSGSVLGTNYIYWVAQVIKRRTGRSTDLSNLNESGGILYELNLRTLHCRQIKAWARYTSAARSLTEHNGQLWWFEGSHYGQQQKTDFGERENLGKVFSLVPGSNPINITDHGVTRKTDYAPPSVDATNYGYHTQMVSPMRSDGDNLYLISGFGGLESITSNQYATNRREPVDAEAETDIRNWHLLKYGDTVEQRIELFNANGKKGWNAIRELSILTNSFIGFDRFGRFYMRPKGGIQARVQTSAPNSVEFKDSNGLFPQRGLISVNGELIAYNGIIGRQFLNLQRGYSGTNIASICAEAVIYNIDSVLTVMEPIFNPITDANIKNTETQLYNHIVINYDDPKPYEFEDGISIATYGKRTYTVSLPLSRYQSAWVEEIARRFVDYHKEMHYLINVTANNNIDINIADTVYLQIPDRAKFNQPCQVYELNQDIDSQSIDIVLRTL